MFNRLYEEQCLALGKSNMVSWIMKDYVEETNSAQERKENV